MSLTLFSGYGAPNARLPDSKAMNGQEDRRRSDRAAACNPKGAMSWKRIAKKGQRHLPAGSLAELPFDVAVFN
jgi:hypothetical protein